jgi:hypothetical protein
MYSVSVFDTLRTYPKRRIYALTTRTTLHARRQLEDDHKVRHAGRGFHLHGYGRRHGHRIKKPKRASYDCQGFARNWTSAQAKNWRASTRSVRAWEKDDIEAVLGHHPDGIVIPKVESFEQVEWAASIIEDATNLKQWLEI